MTTVYKSSSGDVLISEMVLSHAKNALNKLRRSEPERVGEIDALAEYVGTLEAKATEEALNPRAVIGANNPPPDETKESPAGWEAIKTHLDDLLTEAENWADGVAIINQSQADEVARLRQDLQAGSTAADAARVEEKRPLDEKIAEIQDRYNAYIAPMKNKSPGKVSKAYAALGNLLSVWLNKLDEEKKAREREAATKAAEAAAEALEARAEAKATTDLSVMEKAEDKLAEAEALLRQAKGVASEKVQAQGSSRAVGLRSVWTAHITDRKAALLHYIKEQPEAFEALVQELADKDARNEATRRTIPGIAFKEEKRV